MRKFISVFIIVLLVSYVFLPSVCFSEINSYIWSNYSDTIAANSNVSASEISLTLESESAILIEQNSGKVLFEKNCHKQLRPASVTKVMTILLIMEALDSGRISLTDKIPCSQNAASMGGSQIWLDTKEELTVNEMLKAICVASANDCTVAMAEYLEGSTEAFVSKMNYRAKELGMNDTCFKNCHGLDEDGHITSSYDISLMSRELLFNHPSITNYTTIYMDTLRDGKSELVNTNKLVRNYSGCTGLKTGSTGLALYNLSASATRDNLSLIAVIMKAPTTQIRFSEAAKLLDYGFSNFTYKELAKKDEILKSVSVDKGLTQSLNLVYSSNSGCLVKKGEDKNIEEIINISDTIHAPVLKGQKLGEISYSINNEIISKVDLIAQEEIKQIGVSIMLDKLFLIWFKMLR